MNQRRRKNARRRPLLPVVVASQRKSSEHPLQITTSMRLHHVFRYRNTGATTPISVSFDDLLEQWEVAITSTQMARLFNAVRVRKVEIWSPMASDLVPVTCTLDWAGTTIGASGNNLKVSDTSMGSNMPAHISARAPPTALAADWQATGGGTAFTIATPSNSIIDLHVSYGVIDDGTAAGGTAAVGATVGANYFRPLNVSGAALIVPLGYPFV